ncbi:MAG: PAS domain-containing protein, partial [Terriglobales bacterium]
DGTYHWSLTRGMPTDFVNGKPTKFIGTCTDINEKKKIQDMLFAQEQKLRMLADGIPQIVWTATAEGTIDFFNHRWLEYTGLTIEQSLNGAWELLIHPNDLEKYLNQWKVACQTGETYEHEFRLKRAVGLGSGNGNGHGKRDSKEQKSSPYLWHLCRAVALRSQSSRILKWFGTWTEIHEQKS